MNKWLAEVQCKLLTRSDDTAVLRLETEDTGELFAACPLPRSGPVAAAVEPVIDSSRYIVLRVVDDATKRHAFLGLGFRSRDAASDLKMALADYEKQLQRSAEAARRRDAHDLGAGGDSSGAAPAAALRDLSLKDKISVSVPVRHAARAHGCSGKVSALSARVLRAEAGQESGRQRRSCSSGGAFAASGARGHACDAARAPGAAAGHRRSSTRSHAHARACACSSCAGGLGDILAPRTRSMNAYA